MSEMNQGVHFRLLGSVGVSIRGEPVPLAEQECTLLAVLLLNADELVDRDRLVDTIWGERPPRNARSQLHSVVSRLRKRLVTGGLRENAIITHQAGYEIRVTRDDVDLWRFRRKVDQARVAAERGEHDVAVSGYRAAVADWRGPAIAGVNSSLLQQAAAGLEEERVRATEERIELELAQGAAGELVAELTELVGLHPYRERLHGALMLALHQDGRRADALAAYQRAHRLLVDEIGTEPGPVLRDLHQRILKEDKSLPPPKRSAVELGAAAGVRRCLPRSVGDFTGRADSVARLVEAARGPAATPVVLAINGMAGIGKTTLAIHVAHLLADRYPDAQLFIDLRGHSLHRPVEPSAALDSLLRQLGVAGGRIPQEFDERAALWRSELAERKALVVLDNVASTAQVTPLLPAGPGCLLLVTSRRKLADLDGAYPLSLDQLSAEEAMTMLARVAGDRVRDEPVSAADVIRSCGHLPLAIRLAGARLAGRTSWRVEDLASRLRGARESLAELAAEDRSVADAFALSYSQLKPAHQRAFRLVGLHPGEEFDAYAVAALVDDDLGTARRMLDDLIDHHLLSEPRPGRFRLHDLVREYARWLVSTAETEAVCSAALQRLFDFYLHTAIRTGAPLEGLADGRAVQLGDAERPDLVGAAAESGGAWLEIERQNFVAAVRAASAVGAPQFAWRLARAGWAFYYYRGYTDDLLETLRCGAAAAERSKSDDAVAEMCNYLASAHYKLGEFGIAERLLERALRIRLRRGDRTGAATTRTNLALVYRRLGRISEAVNHAEQALADQQGETDLRGMGITLQNLGLMYVDLGRYADATRCHRRRLSISRERGDVIGVANPLGSLGAIRTRLGQNEMARRLLTVAYRLQRRAGNRESESVVGNDLGVFHREVGLHDEAVARHRAALAVAEEVGDIAGACTVRNELGRTLRERGDLGVAIDEHGAALSAATRIGLKIERARALDGIGACLVTTEPEAAFRHWQLALAEYQEMGVPEQQEVERSLAAAAPRTRS